MAELNAEELLREYNADDIIKGEGSLERFFQDYPKVRDYRCFYVNFYKNGVTMMANLPFNRQVIFEYQLEYRDGIPNSTKIEDLKYYKPNIKVYRMREDYNKVKNASYKNELKLLKEKYNIKD